MANPAILVNLNRCTGCWTCSMACKVAYGLGEDEWWSRIVTMGGDRIDEPAGQWPDVHMGWMPAFTEKCIACPGRQRDGLEPYCTYNCPTKALTFGDLDDPGSAISKKMSQLSEIGFGEVPGPDVEGPGSKLKVLYMRR